MNKPKIKKAYLWWSLIILFFVILFIGLAGSKNWDFNYAFNLVFETILINNFLGITAILLGLLTFIGYMVIGRGLSGSFIGMLKTVIGVLIFTIGSSTIVGMAGPVFTSISQLGGTTIIPIDPILGWTSSQNFLNNGIVDPSGGVAEGLISTMSFALLIGFFLNILLVVFQKITHVKSIMVTGHIMFIQAGTISAIIYLLMFTMVGSDYSLAGAQWGATLVAGVTLGLYWGYGSSMTYKATQTVTNDAGFAIGHQLMFGIALTTKIAKYFGDPNDSAETKRVSSKLKIFEDNVFTQTLIIAVLFLTLIFIVQFAPGLDSSLRFGVIDPKTGVMVLNKAAYGGWNVANGAYWLINALLGCVKVVAGLIVLVTGVRMFVAELQQSFQGIAEKVIPDAAVAVDIAAIYAYSPNSLTYGFVSGVIAQFTAVGCIIGISLATHGAFPIVVPLFITLFFNSGSIGIFANAKGGWKACIIVPALFGFMELFMSAAGLMVINEVFKEGVSNGMLIDGYSPVQTGYNGLFDWNMVLAPIFAIMGINGISGTPLLGGASLWIGLIILWGGLIISGFFVTYEKGEDHSKTYYFILNKILGKKSGGQKIANSNGDAEVGSNKFENYIIKVDANEKIAKKEGMHIIAACGQGMGTSMMIRMKVEKVAKEINLKNPKIEAMSAGQAHSFMDSADIIICPKHLSNQFDGAKAKIIGIENIMSGSEIKGKLLSYIENDVVNTSQLKTNTSQLESGVK